MSIRTEIIWALALGAGLLLVMFHIDPAAAWGGSPPPVVNTTEITNITNITEFDGNKFHSSMAQVMAADAIHCTTSSRKHQVGVGSGWSDGHSGFAAGYCHSIEFNGQPVMIGVKASAATDAEPKYSVGMNWTF